MVESIQHGMADLAMHSTTRINVRTLHRINEKKSSILNTCHARLDVFRRILLRCEHFIFLHHDDVSVSLRGKSIHELYSRIRRRQLDVRSVRSLFIAHLLKALTRVYHFLMSHTFTRNNTTRTFSNINTRTPRSNTGTLRSTTTVYKMLRDSLRVSIS